MKTAMMPAKTGDFFGGIALAKLAGNWQNKITKQGGLKKCLFREIY